MGDTAPRSLCLGGELLIPLRGAAVLFVHRPWISEKLQSGTNQTLSQLTPKRAGLLSSPPSPPPSSGGPPSTGPPQWTSLNPPLTLQYRLKPTGLSPEEALDELSTMYKVYLQDSKQVHRLSRVVTLTRRQETILKAINPALLKAQN